MLATRADRKASYRVTSWLCPCQEQHEEAERCSCWTMGECAICLRRVSLRTEAFVCSTDPHASASCFHRFHLECILRWADEQRARSSAGPGGPAPPPTCPLCRQPFVAIVHDCVDTSFQVTWVAEQPQGTDGGRHTDRLPRAQLQLTPAQRRRRSRYYHAAGAAPPPLPSLPPLRHDDGNARRQRRPRPISDPLVEVWLTRELQALLLDEDVRVVVAAALGALQQHEHLGPVLRGQVPRPQTAFNDAGEAGQRRGPLALALQPFFPADSQTAEQVADELEAFLLSGLSLQAYDEAVFEPAEENADDDGD